MTVEEINLKEEIESINVNNSKALFYMNEENYEKAIQTLERNKKYLKMIEDKNPLYHANLIIVRVMLINYNNVAYCYQKLNNLSLCIENLKVAIGYYNNYIKNTFFIDDYYKVDKFEELLNSKPKLDKIKFLGEYILQTRFEAKFRLQLCAVLSQFGTHNEALENAQFALKLCEENINKTLLLADLVQTTYFKANGGNEQYFKSKIESINFDHSKKSINSSFDIKNNESKQSVKDSISSLINDYKELKLKSKQNDSTHSPISSSGNVQQFQISNQNSLILLEYNGFCEQVQECKGLLLSLNEVIDKNKQTKENKIILTENDIEEFRNKKYFKSTSRNILGVKKQDDWINYLNIGNIMFITALSFDDLDLESDYKFELLKDAIMEKIIMIAISIFSLSSEARLMNQSIYSAESKHRLSIEISCKYLPIACPITMHFISSYFKHYSHLQPLEIKDNKKLDIYQSVTNIKANSNNSISITAELEMAKKKNKIHLLNKSLKPPINPIRNNLSSLTKANLNTPSVSKKLNVSHQPVKINVVSNFISKEKTKPIVKSNSEVIQISSPKESSSHSSRTNQIKKNIINLCENSNTLDNKRQEKPSKSPNIFSNNNNIISLFTKSITSFKNISKSFSQNKNELESKRISTSNSNTNLKSHNNDKIDNLSIIFKTTNAIEINKEIHKIRETSNDKKSTIQDLQMNLSNKTKPIIVNIPSNKYNTDLSHSSFDVKKVEKKLIKNYILKINPGNSQKTSTSSLIYSNYNKSVSYVESNVINKKK